MSKPPDWYRRLLDTCPPAAHTEPDWELPDRLHKYEALVDMTHLATADGRRFGLMDHQRLVLRLHSEYYPDTGMPRFFEVDLLSPRQIGKTTVQFLTAMERMLLRDRPQRCVYSSQSHNAGLKKMKDDWIPLILRSGLREPADMGWSLNTLRAEIRTGAGSYFRVVAGGAENADRGITSIDYVVIDEALSDKDDRKERVLAPAMMTVADSQQFLASTPGNMLSFYLMDKRRRALTLLNQADSPVAIVEYAANMDADPYLEPTWYTANPALGQSIPISAYRRMAESMSENAFRREGLGQWVPDQDMPGGIPNDIWLQAQTLDDPHEQYGPTAVLGVDCSPDQSRLTACVSDGQVVRLVGQTDEVADAVTWIARKLAETGARRLCVQKNWSLAHKTDELRDLPDVDIMEVARVEWLQACGVTLSAFLEREIMVRQSQPLNDANMAAVRRPRDSRWVWDRGVPDASISPLVALTLAVAGARSNEWVGLPQVVQL